MVCVSAGWHLKRIWATCNMPPNYFSQAWIWRKELFYLFLVLVGLEIFAHEPNQEYFVEENLSFRDHGRQNHSCPYHTRFSIQLYFAWVLEKLLSVKVWTFDMQFWEIRTRVLTELTQSFQCQGVLDLGWDSLLRDDAIYYDDWYLHL